jgi:hypothetical protein
VALPRLCPQLCPGSSLSTQGLRPSPDFTLRIGPSPDGVVFGAHALAEALAEAYRLLALYPAHK